MRSLLVLALCVGACVGPVVWAHDARPAYLEITQTGVDRYAVLWRTPVLSGMPLPVVLRMPAEARDVVPPKVQTLSDSLVERRLIDVAGGIAGKRIDFPGLQGTISDVLVRVKLGEGTPSTTLVRPSQSWIEIVPAVGSLSVAGAYVAHGVSHILLGFDHLLFVLALVLIVPSLRVLFWTITSFTLAHSITLGLATLGIVRIPAAPVEATIALSIVLLACEILRSRQGKIGLTRRWPWLVAFTFGLLHGFGFAGALAQIGLPQGDIPLALFAFNVGVEVGQLAFIAAVLAAIALWQRLPVPAPVARHATGVVAIGIGVMASFWFVERVSVF